MPNNRAVHNLIWLFLLTFHLRTIWLFLLTFHLRTSLVLASNALLGDNLAKNIV